MTENLPTGPRLAVETLSRLGVAPDRARTLLTASVGQTPSTVVYEENTLELHRYDPDEPRHKTPILVAYALVNRPYILDLQPDRSVVRSLLEEGFTVYLLDWGEPTRLDASLDMADYVGRYLDNCVAAACEDAGVEDLHLVGYCMGGTMSVAYAAVDDSRVRTLGLLATPIVFKGDGGILERWAEYFDPEVAVETLGNMPAEVLSMEFSMMDPVDQYVTKYVDLYENLGDEAFVENFARMERWIWDGVDVAGAAFEEFVTEIYQDNRLVRGEYRLGEEPVDLGDVTVPVLQVVGEYDHIVPAASSTPLGDHVGSDDYRLVEFPRGHIGISVSGKAHRELWPEVADWFAARDAGAESGDADGAGAADETVARVAATAREALGNGSSAADEAGSDADAADVETVDGVGPTYAARLREEGLETTADLAAQDTQLLAALTDAPEKRVEEWLAQVRDDPAQ